MSERLIANPAGIALRRLDQIDNGACIGGRWVISALKPWPVGARDGVIVTA